MTLVFICNSNMATDELLARFVADAAELIDADPLYRDVGAELNRQVDSAYNNHEDMVDTIASLELIAITAEWWLHEAGYVASWEVFRGYEIHTQEL